MMHDRKLKRGSKSALKQNGLYAEEEERLRVDAEGKSEQGAARLDSRLECLRIEAEKIFARFDAEEVERE